MRRTRVLFVVEHVTLAQVVRLRVLAGGLDPARYEVHFASASFDPAIFDATATFARHAIHSIDKRAADEAVARGRRLYDVATLSRYVDDELRLFDAIRPHVVVGDLRWSLSVSAPLAGVPCASLINAYWSPDALRGRWPVPEHPIVRALGHGVARAFFPLAMPFAFRSFAAPLNAVRRRRGLPALGSLVDVLTWGDALLFPDAPELVPMRARAERHHWLGHVGWSPPGDHAALRAWLEARDRARPLIYATLGSSGPVEVAPAVLAALAALPVDVLFATAGRFAPASLPENVRAVDLAPGDLVARHADLVVCNGGASTGYQALQRGVPIVGIPSNLDAYLAMTAMERAGVGVLVRAGQCDATAVRAAITRVLGDSAYRVAAGQAAEAFGRLDPHARFRGVIDSLAAGRARAAE
jgi:UDP:flavonoid glycosyltransferase YjiC (YdhE family)